MSTVSVKKLLGALESVRPGVASKEVIEQSGSFVLDNDRIYTYNDEVAVSIPFDIGLRCAIPSKGFYQLVKQCTVKKIDLEIVDGNLHLTAEDGTDATLTIQEQIALPFDDRIKPDAKQMLPFEWDPGKFREALRFCRFTVSNDSQYMEYCCLHIASDAKGCFVESTDRYRITRRYFSKTPVEGLDLLLPVDASKELVKYEIEMYGKVNGWLHFTCVGGVLFASNTVVAQYPNLAEQVERYGDVVTTVDFPEDIEQVLSQASVLSEVETSKDQLITFVLSEGQVLVRTKGRYGKFKKALPLGYSGKKVLFRIHPDFIGDLFSLSHRLELYQSVVRVVGKGFFHSIILSEDVEA